MQRGVSGEREDPKTRAASERVCHENTAAGGEEKVSPSTGYVSLQQMHQKGRTYKKKDYKYLGHSPQGVASGCLGLIGVCSHPSSNATQEALLPHPLTSPVAGGLEDCPQNSCPPWCGPKSSVSSPCRQKTHQD